MPQVFEQSLFLFAYTIGDFLSPSQIPGGRMAELFGGKWVFFAAVLMNIVPTLLSPAAAKLHWGALVLMRVVEGFGGGFTFPAMNVLISKWAPKEERSMISSLCYGG